MVRTIPFNDWCRLRGFSRSTGWRLVKTGQIRPIRLSARRIGIREDDDAAFLAAGADHAERITEMAPPTRNTRLARAKTALIA